MSGLKALYTSKSNSAQKLVLTILNYEFVLKTEVKSSFKAK